MLSRLAQWKVLICGLPGAPGEKTLALTSHGASPQILSLLDEAICDLATKTRMNGIVYKEFGADDLKWVNPLLDLGYRRLPAPPMHFFRPLFEDFAHYCAALKAPYRRHIKLSTRKLQNAGVSIAVLTDPAEILRLYTPEVHALYYQVVAKTDMKAEVLPIEFFHQLTLRLKGKVDLVAIFRDSKIVAFAWSLHDESSYHLLYGGIDYQFNNELDLYFNLVYATLDRALHERPVKIHVGQTANVFKARLGCYSEPLYVFVKGLGPLMSRVVHYGANFLLAQKPANPPSNVFKETVVESLKDRAKTHCTHASTRCGVQAVDKRPICKI
jgi:predicted N-acyltransferase